MMFFLWFLVIFLGYCYWLQRPENPRFLFSQKLFASLPPNTNKQSLLKKISQWYVFQKTGFFTRITSRVDRISFVATDLKRADYLNLKEIINTFFLILLFIFVLLGDLTAKNVAIFLAYWIFFLFLPDMMLQIQTEKFEKTLENEVPYFIDLFIISLKSGLNIEKALWYTTQKQSILSDIIKQKLHMMSLGIAIEEIFRQMETEIPNKEFAGFVRSIRQAKKLGVSLAYSLDMQSKLIRTKRKQKAEMMSRAAAVKITLPLVLFIFPALLLIYIGPGLAQFLGK